MDSSNFHHRRYNLTFYLLEIHRVRPKTKVVGIQKFFFWDGDGENLFQIHSSSATIGSQCGKVHLVKHLAIQAITLAHYDPLEGCH